MACAGFDESSSGDKGDMECPAGEQISVESATVGRMSKTDCSAGIAKGYDAWRYEVCGKTVDASSEAKSKCNGQTSCQYKYQGGQDPCPGYHKYTQIKYTCGAPVHAG